MSDAVFILAFLLLGYLPGIWLAVLTHEAGHAFAALALCGLPVELEVGRAGRRFSLSLGRLRCVFRSRGLRYGVTRYRRDALSRRRQAGVAAAGPLASVLALAAFAGLAWWFSAMAAPLPMAFAVGVAVAHFRVLLVALWPLEYRPDGPDGESWVSDGLDLWRLWRRRD